MNPALSGSDLLMLAVIELAKPVVAAAVQWLMGQAQGGGGADRPDPDRNRPTMRWDELPAEVASVLSSDAMDRAAEAAEFAAQGDTADAALAFEHATMALLGTVNMHDRRVALSLAIGSALRVSPLFAQDLVDAAERRIGTANEEGET